MSHFCNFGFWTKNSSTILFIRKQFILLKCSIQFLELSAQANAIARAKVVLNKVVLNNKHALRIYMWFRREHCPCNAITFIHVPVCIWHILWWKISWISRRYSWYIIRILMVDWQWPFARGERQCPPLKIRNNVSKDAFCVLKKKCFLIVI